MLSTSGTLASAHFSLLIYIVSNQHLINSCPWVTYGSTLYSYHYWLATLPFRSCALEGRKFSILGMFQIIKNKQNNLFEGPFDDPLIISTLMSLLVSPSSLTFPLGKLFQTVSLFQKLSPPLLPTALPGGSYTQAMHRNDQHRHHRARLMKSSFNSIAIFTPLLSIYIFNIWLVF